LLSYLILVFFSGAFTMTLELAALRLVAAVLGVSIYAWTSVIGFVLAGMSAGSFIGGHVADRVEPRNVVGLVLISSGTVTALILPALPAFGMALPKIAYPLVRALVSVLALFGIPSLVVGLARKYSRHFCPRLLADAEFWHSPNSTGRLAAHRAARNTVPSPNANCGTGVHDLHLVLSVHGFDACGSAGPFR